MSFKGLNVEHILALSFLGFGAIYLLETGHTEAGETLLGALAGYAFRNGMKDLNKVNSKEKS